MSYLAWMTHPVACSSGLVTVLSNHVNLSFLWPASSQDDKSYANSFHLVAYHSNYISRGSKTLLGFLTVIEFFVFLILRRYLSLTTYRCVRHSNGF